MYSIRDILLLAAVGISLPICLVRPVYGIFAWTILGFLNPQSFTWGAAREAPLAQAIAIPTLVGFFFKAPFKRLFCGETVLLGILWLWFIITTFNSFSTPVLAEKGADCWFRLSFVSKIFLMTMVTVALVNTRARLRLLMLTIAGSFALLVFHTLPGMILSGGNYRIYGPENSMVADNTAFGLALDMVLPFFFYLAKTESDRRLKWGFGLAFLVGIPVTFFTYSRGALVGLVVMSLLLLLQSKQKLFLAPIILLAVLFAVFLTPEAWKERMGGMAEGNLDNSALSRLNAWTYSWNLAKAYPVMGGGFEAFTPALFALYAPNPKDVHGPHSIYFGVLLEQGFVGLLLYFLLVGYCFMALHWIVKQGRLRDDEEAVKYAFILRCSLVGFLAAGAFLGRTYFDFFFMIVACTGILRRTCREEWAEPAVLYSEGEGEDGEDTLLSQPAYS